MGDREETAAQGDAARGDAARGDVAREEAREAAARSEAAEEDDDVGSPFDHPAFLPVLLFGMALWFGYDGWFSETIESVRFNRYGFFFLLGAALYFTAVELTSLRFLLPTLFLVYAAWLGAFHGLGSPEAWWKDDPGAAAFNRYGALACLAAAAVAGIREWRRGPSPEASEPAS